MTLCELVNKIQPGSAKKISSSKMPFPQRENIKKFCDGAKVRCDIDPGGSPPQRFQ